MSKLLPTAGRQISNEIQNLNGLERRNLTFACLPNRQGFWHFEFVSDFENSDGRLRWRNGDVRSAVISTILRKAILMGISLQVLLLKTCLTVGFVRCVAPQKICLKGLSIATLFREGLIDLF
jgi:hypothetical protein